MKKLLSKTLIIAELVFVVWFALSWLNVIANNTAPYGELAVWNMFSLIFG
jgi:hypothetical protein